MLKIQNIEQYFEPTTCLQCVICGELVNHNYKENLEEHLDDNHGEMEL